MSYFTGRRDPKQTARDAIVSLREQLMMIEKKEEHLNRQIAQDLATAKANAVSNKNGMAFFTPPSSMRRNEQLADMMTGVAHAIPFHFFFFLGGLWAFSGYRCAEAKEDAPDGP